MAIVGVADVAPDEAKIRPLLAGHPCFNLIQVVLMAGGKVVQPDNALIELQQGLQQVAADESCHSRHQP